MMPTLPQTDIHRFFVPSPSFTPEAVPSLPLDGDRCSRIHAATREWREEEELSRLELWISNFADVPLIHFKKIMGISLTGLVGLSIVSSSIPLAVFTAFLAVSTVAHLLAIKLLLMRSPLEEF